MKRGFLKRAPTSRTSRPALRSSKRAAKGEELSSYVDTHRMFARGEMIRLCKEALASGPRTTKEQLAIHVMAAKGMRTGDKVLAHATAQRMIHARRGD
jgi:hypothetical protein